VHKHVERLVSVVKIATAFEVCTTEEQCSVVFFFCVCRQNDLTERIFIKKCFLFIDISCL
jgi:hypothetical protein